MIFVLATANILTIAADLNGIAAILHLLTGYSTISLLIPTTAIIAGLITFGTYNQIREILVWLTLLLGVYILSAIMAKPPLLEVLRDTLIPHIQMKSAWVIAALGLLGTTISPYLLFWQASEEREEKKSVVQADEVDFDTAVGMIWSNLLAFSMILTGAVMLYHTHTEVQDVSTLALALKPISKEWAFALFSLGILISGLLAVPVLAGSTAYAVADTFGWREGMDNKISDAKGFYIVFLGSLIVGDIIDLIPQISVVDALYYSQVLDGVLIPVLIGIAVMIGRNRKIMGDFTISRFENIFAILAMIVTIALSIFMFYRMIQG